MGQNSFDPPDRFPHPCHGVPRTQVPAALTPPSSPVAPNLTTTLARTCSPHRAGLCGPPDLLAPAPPPTPSAHAPVGGQDVDMEREGLAAAGQLDL
eukprot:scaffold27839_cov129-Isochrysis_galbana.AAC.4